MRFSPTWSSAMTRAIMDALKAHVSLGGQIFEEVAVANVTTTALEEQIAEIVEADAAAKAQTQQQAQPQQRSYNGRELRLNRGLVGRCAAARRWAWTGFMGPDAAFNGIDARAECVRFAREKNVFKQGDLIEAVNMRIRNASWVYDLIAPHRAARSSSPDRAL
jgi:hypothetical protein